jgi:hypothetical protein
MCDEIANRTQEIRSRRRKEADLSSESLAISVPPPHVGGYAVALVAFGMDFSAVIPPKRVLARSRDFL